MKLIINGIELKNPKKPRLPRKAKKNIKKRMAILLIKEKIKFGKNGKRKVIFNYGLETFNFIVKRKRVKWIK